MRRAPKKVTSATTNRRYNVTIGRAARDIPAGSWVHERLLRMPDAVSLADAPPTPRMK